MFNETIFQDALASYKQKFVTSWWHDEKYKWEAVKCFQDNWDINVPDFADMLTRSLEKTYNLLSSMNNFPKDMIKGLSKVAPEEVRGMFLTLFDENKNVVNRIIEFKEMSEKLHANYNNNEGQHFQSENAISTYLWLRFPEKYYIYKYSEAKAAASKLESELIFKKGAYEENLRNFYSLYDEINKKLREDNEIRRLLESRLSDSCYADPELKTLTIDFAFFVSRYYLKDKNSVIRGEDFPVESISQTPNVTESVLDEAERKLKPYTKTDFLSEVYMSEYQYDALVTVLQNKKNIILQGAPGVGKTFVAKRLAYSLMGEKDEDRIEFIQFHQNYSYEDFMMGYKPVQDGFELKHGVFYQFCQKATADPERDYYFIIDEINRGNMSKIFGELLMLIENDYRGMESTLAYNGEAFAVPKNLYIIGMMNTADRSLAMIDYALRRRFSFYEMESGFDSEGFLQYQKQLDCERFDLLIEKVKELNKEITADKSLGKGFCIGHSFFCGQASCDDEKLQFIVEFDILPTLSEYWFDDLTKLQRWENILRGIFHD